MNIFTILGLLSLATGFEPARGDPNGLAGRRFNHSATLTYSPKNYKCSFARYGSSYTPTVRKNRILFHNGFIWSTQQRDSETKFALANWFIIIFIKFFISRDLCCKLI